MIKQTKSYFKEELDDDHHYDYDFLGGQLFWGVDFFEGSIYLGGNKFWGIKICWGSNILVVQNFGGVNKLGSTFLGVIFGLAEGRECADPGATTMSEP